MVGEGGEAEVPAGAVPGCDRFVAEALGEGHHRLVAVGAELDADELAAPGERPAGGRIPGLDGAVEHGAVVTGGLAGFAGGGPLGVVVEEQRGADAAARR